MTKNIIVETCKDFDEYLNRYPDKEEFFDECVREKLTSIYEKDNRQFSTLLADLDKYINLNNYNQVKTCVRKLLKLLNSNTQTLIDVLGRLYK